MATADDHNGTTDSLRRLAAEIKAGRKEAHERMAAVREAAALFRRLADAARR